MSEPVTLYSRPERLTIAKIRRPLSKAAQNLLAKATEMEACGEARNVDDAMDTLRLAADPDYLTVAAETDGTVVITKAAPDAPNPFDAMYAVAKRLVDTGQARTVPDAVDLLRVQRHPTYQAWMGRTTPAPTTTTPTGEVERVIKSAQEQQFAKRRAVQAEINKRTTALVRAGKAASEMEALSAVFKADRELYEEYRKASYARGPLFPDTAPAPAVVPDLPAYAMAKKMALELKQNDPWGEHSGKSQQELVEKVLRDNPALYEAVRQESYSRL